MIMAQKIFYYIVSSTEIEDNYDTFASLNKNEESFSDEKILLTNLRKTIKKKDGDPLSFEELFIEFGNKIVDILTTLFLIKHKNTKLHNTLYLYYHFDKEIRYKTFHFNLWCLSEESKYNISITNSHIEDLLSLIRENITDTDTDNLQRNLAILTNFYYADNICDENRIVEQFLLYWASFNALYRSFRITYISPIIKSLHDNIDKARRPIISWGDVTEVGLAQQIFEFDDCKLIYDLRNSIIHGNIIIPFHCPNDQNALKSKALTYSVALRRIILFNYLCCFEKREQWEFKDKLCQICITLLESKFRNKEFTECSQEQVDEQIQAYHQQLEDNYHRMQSDWDG